MLYEDARLLPKEALAPDVLIVGAGAVGLMLGLLLSRAGRRVTIIEAGPKEPPSDYRRRNVGPVSGRPHRGIIEGRVKALGGTTRLWGGQLVAFSEADFERAPNDGGRWPVEYNDMQRHVDSALDFVGVSQGSAPSAQGADPDAFSLGDDFRLSHHLWLKTPDFVDLFGEELASDTDLAVITGLEARALKFSGRGVHEVESRAGSGKEIVFRAHHVVLANGTMELVRLLLRSQAVEPNCPFRENQLIGKGFMDHLHGPAGLIKEPNYPRIRRLFETKFHNGFKCSAKIHASDQFLIRNKFSSCAASLVSKASLRQYMEESILLLRRLFFHPGAKSAREAVTRTLSIARILPPAAWNYVVEKRTYNLFGGDMRLGLEVEQLPTPDSYLFLDPEEDPRDAAIGVHWSLGGAEIEAVSTFCTELSDRFERAGLGRIALDERLTRKDPSFFDGFLDAYHHMGGARMSQNATTGVVDHELRVHGAANLWVLGAAVFPSGSFANPTLMAMAFAGRLAETLTSRLTSAERACS